MPSANYPLDLFTGKEFVASGVLMLLFYASNGPFTLALEPVWNATVANTWYQTERVFEVKGELCSVRNMFID